MTSRPQTPHPAAGTAGDPETDGSAPASPRMTPVLMEKDAKALARALAAGDVTVFVDGTALRLPPAARDAVLDLLARLAHGSSVTVSSGAGDATPATDPRTPRQAPSSEGPGPLQQTREVPLLTTSQAAAAAGISHTYLRNLTDAGIIPVEYRGSHRRIRLSDVEAWLEEQRQVKARKLTGGTDQRTSVVRTTGKP